MEIWTRNGGGQLIREILCDDEASKGHCGSR